MTEQEKIDAHYLANRIVRRNVQRFRKAQKMTQSQLAKKSNLYPYQICHIEGTNYYNPRWKTLCQVAFGLGVRVCDLFCEQIATTVEKV